MINPNEYKALQNKALAQLKAGQPLFGKDGAFRPLLQEFLEAALEAEMDGHLTEPERAAGNKRNGRGQKTIKSSEGSFEIHPPEDRLSTFQPQIIRKRETLLTDNLQDKIIGLYGLGMSYRDIAKHLDEMYDLQISRDTLTELTNRIIPQVKAWQSRRLEAVYPLVWLDAMFFKVQEDGVVTKKALYNVLGVSPTGQKDLLGCYLGEAEGAKFWLQVLSDLQNRGVEDILIACTDNLKGFQKRF